MQQRGKRPKPVETLDLHFANKYFWRNLDSDYYFRSLVWSPVDRRHKSSKLLSQNEFWDHRKGDLRHSMFSHCSSGEKWKPKSAQFTEKETEPDKSSSHSSFDDGNWSCHHGRSNRNCTRSRYRYLAGRCIFPNRRRLSFVSLVWFVSPLSHWCG